MATEDRRYLHVIHHEAARARKMKGPQVVAACQKNVGVQKHIVWNWWHATNCPAFRRIVEMCRVVGINFYIEQDKKLHKIEFDDRAARKGHWILLGDVVNLGSALDDLAPDQRDALTVLAEHFQKTASIAKTFAQLDGEQQKSIRMILGRYVKENEAKKKAAERPAKRKAARAA